MNSTYVWSNDDDFMKYTFKLEQIVAKFDCLL